MRLIRGMGLADQLQGQEIIGVTTTLGIDTLRLMGMVVHRGSRLILTPIST